MRYQGKISNWKDDQGFGFITPNGGGAQVFVHIKSFANRRRRPIENEIVTYELGTDKRGRAQAGSVAFLGEQLESGASFAQGNGPIIFTAAFLIFITTLVVSGYLPSVALKLYFFASIFAFIFYAIDKSAARNNRRRTPESTLHFFALVGGWPGALAAQRLLRHKSRKESFQWVFWVTVILNCSALGWVLTPSGSELLHSLTK